jgi:integrase/recombinase XerD
VSSVHYWTVVDAVTAEEHPLFHEFLRHKRLTEERAEGTTKRYAEALCRFGQWVRSTGRTWEAAAEDLDLYATNLRTTPTTRRGAGHGRPPQEARIGSLLTVVRSFYVWACWRGYVNDDVLHRLYTGWRSSADGGVPPGAKVAHRARNDENLSVQWARVDEVVALYQAALNWRDRLFVLLLAFAGLRIGEAAGLRIADVHTMPNPSVVGCRREESGPHLHVVRRDNPNGATAKSGRERVVPLPDPLMVAYGEYRAWLHHRLARHGRTPEFVLVDIRTSSPSAGGPVTTDSLRDQLKAMASRAGVRATITPHQLRHFFGTELARSGEAVHVIQTLIGHASIVSTQVYMHSSDEDMRRAVARLGSILNQPEER